MVPETRLGATIAISLVVPRGRLITFSHAPKSSRAQKERSLEPARPLQSDYLPRELNVP